MSFIPTVLIVTGTIILVVALVHFRKPADSLDHIAVHPRMNDDVIGNQLKHRAPRAEAGLCVFLVFAL